MADDPEPAFDSDADALAHFRERCRTLSDQLATAEQDILDFTESSKELQAELEQELERVEAAEQSLRRDLDSARTAADEWKLKYTTALRDHSQTMVHMQRELETLRTSERDLRARVRDMELDNDDLEKSEREKDSSLQDLESRYNKSLERIALLEEELVNKAQLEEEVQRLKDELREVNEELSYTRAQLAAVPPPPSSSVPPPVPNEPESPTPLPSVPAGDLPSRRTPCPTVPSPARSPSPPPTTTNGRTSPTRLASPSSRVPASGSSTSVVSAPSPSKIARSASASYVTSSVMPPPASPAPFRAPLVQGAPALTRSTRTAQLARTTGSGRDGAGLTSSPSTPNLPSSAAGAAHRRVASRGGPATPLYTATARGGSGAAAAIPRTDTATMIRDMQQMTTRVRALTQRLDLRRESVMRGSAIPRMGSPTGAVAAGGAGGMSRSATLRGLRGATPSNAGVSGGAGGGGPGGMVTRPSSRLGAASSARESSRPPSRASSLATTATTRPGSRLGSSTGAKAFALGRPGSPAPGSELDGGRLPLRGARGIQAAGSITTTSSTSSSRASTRPSSALGYSHGLGRSLGPSAGAGVGRGDRPGADSDAAALERRASLSRSVQSRSGSARASGSASGRSTPGLPSSAALLAAQQQLPRRPASALSQVSQTSANSAAMTGPPAVAGASKVARRVSGGFGLLGRSIRRRSVSRADEQGIVPPLPTTTSWVAPDVGFGGDRGGER